MIGVDPTQMKYYYRKLSEHPHCSGINSVAIVEKKTVVM